jgi:hypothetical protein
VDTSPQAESNHNLFGRSTVEPVTFVRAITGCGPEHFIELRWFRADRTVPVRGHYSPRTDLRTLAVDLQQATRQKFNSYFGVAPRTEKGKGDRAHCAGLNAFYVDVDFKTMPEDLARERLSVFALPPSATTDTGGGIHPYWMLERSLIFPDDFDRARSLLRRLCITLGGDIAAAEPVRILRVPHSINYKYDPPRPVSLAHFDPKLRYDVSDFEDLLASVEDPRKRGSEGKEGGASGAVLEWKEPEPRDPNSTLPGDILNVRASWSDVLEPHGWCLAHVCGTARYWTRPGKVSGISASTNYDGLDILWCFTSNSAPLEAGRGYTKFHIFTLLECHGDYAAAARELWAVR